MNSADMAMENKGFWLSGWMSQFLNDLTFDTLYTLERIGWWGHLIMVLVFLKLSTIFQTSTYTFCLSKYLLY
jgi:hypothetical protein